MTKNPPRFSTYFDVPPGTVNPPARTHIKAILVGFAAAAAVAIPVAKLALMHLKHEHDAYVKAHMPAPVQTSVKASQPTP